MEEAPAIFNCARVVLYMYVEHGIVAVQNPEGEMLEFLTIEEAGIAGEMFNSSAPRFLSTRTHAMNKKEEEDVFDDAPTDVDASSSPKRVTIVDVRTLRRCWTGGCITGFPFHFCGFRSLRHVSDTFFVCPSLKLGHPLQVF